MLSVLLLCWAVLKLHAPPCTCYPLQLAPSPHGMPGDPEEQGQAKTKGFRYNFFMEDSYKGRERKTIKEDSKGIFTYLKNQPKGCFSVLTMKGIKFFCLDSKRRLYISVDDSKEDCRFRIKRHKDYDVFRSCRGEVLLIHQKTKAAMHTQNTSEQSVFLSLKRHKEHTNSRKRRSWHTDPSDPLGSEYPDVRAINNQRREPQYSSNISKQTIAIVDDPLQVLLSHSPLSPTLEKNRKSKKIRF